MDATAVSDDRDRALLARWCEARDHGAFAALVERHRPLVAAVCRRELRDPAEADDVAQEVFISLAEEAASIRGAPGAWLRTVAVHRCLNQVRARQRRRLHEARGAGERQPALDPIGEDEELVTACLAELDQGERDLLVQLFFLGHSQAEVARSAQVSALVVHRRVHRALANLRERFARRKRRIGVSALVLLLAGGDRALAATVAGGAVPVAWWAAGIIAAGAAMTALIAQSASIRAESSSGTGEQPAREAAADPVRSPSRVSTGTASPASAAAALPPVADQDQGWGRPAAEDDPAAAAGPIVFTRLQWCGFETLRILAVLPGQMPSGPIERWPERSEVFTTSRFVIQENFPGPAVLHLPGSAWRVKPPPGRELVVYRADWEQDAGCEQVIASVPSGSTPERALWSVSRQVAVPGTDGRSLLSVTDAIFLDRNGIHRQLADRQWRWRQLRRSIRPLTVANPVLMVGWAVQPLPDAEAAALIAACSASSGTVRLDR